VRATELGPAIATQLPEECEGRDVQSREGPYWPPLVTLWLGVPRVIEHAICVNALGGWVEVINAGESADKESKGLPCSAGTRNQGAANKACCNHHLEPRSCPVSLQRGYVMTTIAAYEPIVVYLQWHSDYCWL